MGMDTGFEQAIDNSRKLLQATRAALAECRIGRSIAVSCLRNTRKSIASTHDLIRQTDETIIKYGALASRFIEKT